MTRHKINSAIKWHGGKTYLAKDIINLMPPHLHYVEPYFGGGAVLLAKNPLGISEVVNDIHGGLTNFWQVLQDDATFSAFQRKIEATPFSQVEFEIARSSYSQDWDVDAAVAFFVFCRQSRAAQMKDFATLSRNRTRRKMNEQASAWLTAIEGLPDIHDRLKRVVILNDDALNVIRTQDGPKTLFYLDPPYMAETRASADVYRHEMSDADHSSLLKMLSGIRGKFLLSGYRNSLYDDVANQNGWQRVDFERPNNAAGGASKRRMIECVWMNYTPEKN